MLELMIIAMSFVHTDRPSNTNYRKASRLQKT